MEADNCGGDNNSVVAPSLQAEREQSAGWGWFDMPAPQLTQEIKNDLKLLRMRNALDPTRHYKTADSKKLPRYFQVSSVCSFRSTSGGEMVGMF